MREKIRLNDIAVHSKGQQINGTDLIENGTYDYLNGGINPSGKWNEYNNEGNTVTISEGGNSSGYVNYMVEPFWCGAHCYYLCDVKGNSKYLYYALKSKQEEIMQLRTGAAMPNIKKSVLGEFSFTYDNNAEEQVKVVQILETTEKIIANRKAQLFQLDNLIKSRFVEMFDNVENSIKLEKVARIGSSHRIFTDEFVDSGIPFYRGTEIKLLSQGISDFKPYYISENRYLEIATDYTKPEIGDILMPSICDNGQLWIVNTNEPFYYKDGRVLSIRPNPKMIIPEFLHFHLKMKLTEIYKEIATGAVFAEFKIFLLKDVDIVLPSITQQHQFVDFVKQIDRLKFVVQKSLDETLVLFDSLMQEYFG